MRAILALADGAHFEGTAFGAEGATVGEVVFNTGMTGYQEVLTDPSYAGQIVALTYPLIGNYGVNVDDVESRQVQVSGFVVHQLADVFSNWRASESLDSFLKRQNVVGVTGVDTRALTRRLRYEGVMMGVLATGDELDPAALVAQAAGERAGIDPGDADDDLALQERVQGLGRAPVREEVGKLVDDEPADLDLARLHVVHVHAVIAD